MSDEADVEDLGAWRGHARDTLRVAVPARSSRVAVPRPAMKAAQLEVLALTSEALAVHGQVRAVLGRCAAACLQVPGVTGVALHLTQRDTGELLLEYQQGFSLAAVEAAERSHRLLAQVARAAQVRALPAPAGPGPGEGHLLRTLGVDAALALPLTWAGHAFGTLLLGGRGLDLDGGEMLSFAELIATHLAQALALAETLGQLSAARTRYRALMDHANDGICLLDECGFVLEANQRFASWLGRTTFEMIGLHIRDFAAPGHLESNLARFRASLGRGAGCSTEIVLAARDGTVLALELSYASVELDGRRAMVCISRDVREQQRTQAQLMVADRMASVGMLAAGVAHEINNPLAAVLTNLELATRDLDDLALAPGVADELTCDLADAREGAERVRQIVRDLRVFSRHDDEASGPVAVERVLDSSARLAWNELRHRAHLVKDYGPAPAVHGNEARLGQVFLNLIVNAAQAIPEGHADDHEVRLTTRAVGGRVVVEVRDTGCGMAPAELAQLFTPFFTTKPVGVGTGLGLSICQRIVSELGGRIDVESAPGKGTTFRVELPASAAPARVPCAPSPAVPPLAGATPPRGHVLIVDDDPLVVRLLHRSLSPEHQVTAVARACEALDLVLAGERFDVILCDVMMPEMTGLELHEAICARAPAELERLVFLTGGAFTPAARAFLDQVPNLQVEKPFDVDALRRLVQERVAARRG